MGGDSRLGQRRVCVRVRLFAQVALSLLSSRAARGSLASAAVLAVLVAAAALRPTGLSCQIGSRPEATARATRLWLGETGRTSGEPRGRDSTPERSAGMIFDEMPFLPARPGMGTVTCPISATVDGFTWGIVTSEGHDAIFSAALINSRVVAQVPAGSGRGDFVFEDLLRGHLSWVDLSVGGATACADGDVDAWRTGLHGRVDGIPLPESHVRGCMGWETIVDGTFFMTVDAPTTCEVRVESVLAGRWAVGPAVLVHTEIGRDLEVALRYPTEMDYQTLPDEEQRRHREFYRKRSGAVEAIDSAQ